MFTHDTTVKLHQTDAAGLLFFAHQFTMIHDAYELYMESIGFDFATILRESDFLLAIVHAEADFNKPLYVGDRLKINLTTESSGETSYTLAYDLINDNSQTVGTGRTVHVCVDKKSGQKRSLPQALRAELNG